MMRLALAAGMVSLLCVLSLIPTYGKLGNKREEFWLEVAKSLLQVGVFGILGLAAAAFMEKFKLSLQQAEAKIAMRRKFVAQFMRAYNSTKRVRRMLQARPEKMNTGRRTLMNAQLDFEFLKRMASFYFDDHRIEQALKDMEHYLNQVLEEILRGSAGPNFKSFVAEPSSPEFHKHFPDQRRLILDLTSAESTGRRSTV